MAMPAVRPIHTIHNISRNTIERIRPGPAPNAMRMPISRVRRVTLWAITPQRPSMASAVARTAKAAANCSTRRSERTLRRIWSSSVRRSSTGRSRSSDDMTRRILAEQLGGRQGGADVEAERVDLLVLAPGYVVELGRVLLHAGVMAVLDDADDLDIGRLAAGGHAHADGITAGEERLDELLVDHRDLRAGEVVGLADLAARDQRNPHLAEEARTDLVEE